ncbi:MAG: peptidoglycan-binding protein [Oscillospiraceae bacterium]|nr:peptidoglycan-binding protein [Oscillospiraceae bacterium]
MNTYDVTGLRCEIVRPNMTLVAWTLTHLPTAVCNASLYDFKTYEPVGTIIENGKLVHNAGNGYGIGVKDGKLGFGTPWGESWTDYLTGYNACVQQGKYVKPAWKDSYVFDCALSRIAIGRQGSKTFIVTDDGVTLKQFAQSAIKSGFDTLVNLDGGGSRHLYYNGATVYGSGRVPYNAIAWYGDLPKTACPFPTPTRLLRWGASGDDVRWLQWQLNRHGVKLTVDGGFGVLTWTAVRKFQRTKGLDVDGVVGEMTISALSGAV